MTSKVRQVLAELHARLKELYGERLVRLVLFGSQARDDASQDSDIDALVLLNATVTREVEDSVNDCAWEAGLAHGAVVVPVTVSRYDWEEGLLSSSLLAIAVRQEGITV